MKKILILMAVLCTVLSSQAQDFDAPIKVASGYVSSDISLSKDTTVTVGIIASKAEDKDVLISFDETATYDAAATGTSVYSESLTGSNGNNYTKDISIKTRNTAGTEKYTFTVINRDGLKNSVSLKITVN
jgi:hypothetical protein